MKKIISILLIFSLILGVISASFMTFAEEATTPTIFNLINDLKVLDSSGILNHSHWQFQYNTTVNREDGWVAFDTVKSYKTVSVNAANDGSLGYCINDGTWKIKNFNNGSASVDMNQGAFAAAWYANQDGLIQIDAASVNLFWQDSTYGAKQFRITVNGNKAWTLGDENGWLEFKNSALSYPKNATTSFIVKNGDVVRFEVRATELSSTNTIEIFKWNPAFSFSAIEYPSQFNLNSDFGPLKGSEEGILSAPYWQFQYNTAINNLDGWVAFDKVKSYNTVSVNAANDASLGYCINDGVWKIKNFNNGSASVDMNQGAFAAAWYAKQDGLIQIDAGSVNLFWQDSTYGAKQFRITVNGNKAWTLGDENGWVEFEDDAALYNSFYINIKNGDIVRFEVRATELSSTNTIEIFKWVPSFRVHDNSFIEEETQNIIKAIDEISEMASPSRNTVKSIGDRYNTLEDTQKALVTNYNTLYQIQKKYGLIKSSFNMVSDLREQKLENEWWSVKYIDNSQDNAIWKPFTKVGTYNTLGIGTSDFGLCLDDGGNWKFLQSESENPNLNNVVLAAEWMSFADGIIRLHSASLSRFWQDPEHQKVYFRVTKNGKSAWTLGDENGWVELVKSKSYPECDISVSENDVIKFEIYSPEFSNIDRVVNTIWNPTFDFDIILPEDREAAQKVSESISQLNESDKEKAELILIDYESLSPIQRSLVDNYDVLKKILWSFAPEMGQDTFNLLNDIKSYGDVMDGIWWNLEYIDLSNDKNDWKTFDALGQFNIWRPINSKATDFGYGIDDYSCWSFKRNQGNFDVTKVVLSAKWTAQRSGSILINKNSVKRFWMENADKYESVYIRVTKNGVPAWKQGEDDGWKAIESTGKYNAFVIDVEAGDIVRFEFKVPEFLDDDYSTLVWNPTFSYVHIDETERKIAQTISSQIDRIGEVTLDIEEDIVSLFEAYSNLSEIEQALVDNSYKLYEMNEILRQLNEIKQRKFNLSQDLYNYGDSCKGKFWELQYLDLENTNKGWQPFNYIGAYSIRMPFYGADMLGFELMGNGGTAYWLLNNYTDYFDCSKYVIAATWTAAEQGNLVISNGKLKRPFGELNEIFCRITKNDVNVWKDGEGEDGWLSLTVPQKYSSLTIPVNAGDKIRFEVKCSDYSYHNRSCVDWNPTLAFYLEGEDTNPTDWSILVDDGVWDDFSKWDNPYVWKGTSKVSDVNDTENDVDSNTEPEVNPEKKPSSSQKADSDSSNNIYNYIYFFIAGGVVISIGIVVFLYYYKKRKGKNYE